MSSFLLYFHWKLATQPDSPSPLWRNEMHPLDGGTKTSPWGRRKDISLRKTQRQHLYRESKASPWGRHTDITFRETQGKYRDITLRERKTERRHLDGDKKTSPRGRHKDITFRRLSPWGRHKYINFRETQGKYRDITLRERETQRRHLDGDKKPSLRRHLRETQDITLRETQRRHQEGDKKTSLWWRHPEGDTRHRLEGGTETSPGGRQKDKKKTVTNI